MTNLIRQLTERKRKRKEISLNILQSNKILDFRLLDPADVQVENDKRKYEIRNL